MTQTQSSPSGTFSPADIRQLQVKAEAGDLAAQLNLATAYDKGDGVPQSDKQAMRWYRAAADQGNATAQNSVGLMFRSGRGAEQDKVEALKWYRKAAKQGHANAMFNLGAAYYNGDGTGIDDTLAYAWFLLAQSFGSQAANDAVQRMKDEAIGLQSDACDKIGDMYRAGEELAQSPGQALNWYRQAAENGQGAAQIKLARFLLQGKDGTPDYAEVRRLCEKAAKMNYPAAAFCIGELYEQGLGVARDLPIAAKWFTEGASLGHAPAGYGWERCTGRERALSKITFSPMPSSPWQRCPNCHRLCRRENVWKRN